MSFAIHNSDVSSANLATVEGYYHSQATNEVEAGPDIYTDDVVREVPARGLRFAGKRALVAFFYILAAGVMAIACGGSSTVDNSRDIVPSLGSAYSYGDAEFAIRPPEGWTVNEGTLGALVIFHSKEPDTHNDIPFVSNINIIGQDAQGYSLTEYVTAAKEFSARLFADYELIEDKQQAVNGMDVHVLGATFVQGQFPLRNRQLILISDGKAYEVTATALQETWDKYEAMFGASMGTFVVDP